MVESKGGSDRPRGGGGGGGDSMAHKGIFE
jgi:hypothetical protein